MSNDKLGVIISPPGRSTVLDAASGFCESAGAFYIVSQMNMRYKIAYSFVQKDEDAFHPLYIINAGRGHFSGIGGHFPSQLLHHPLHPGRIRVQIARRRRQVAVAYSKLSKCARTILICG